MRKNINRDCIAKKYCHGNGVEIGAGDCPTAINSNSTVVYLDKRDPNELKNYFQSEEIIVPQKISSLQSNKFDFLMAHHVLEHSPNPIATLIEWFSLLKDKGVMFITLTNKHITPDKPRIQTPLTHFILDYLYSVSDDDYESREHIGNFLWAWSNEGGLSGLDKNSAANSVFAATNASGNDLHWHVFNIQTIKAILKLAADLSGISIEVLYEEDGFKLESEHRVVCKLTYKKNEQNLLIDKLIKIKNELRSVVYKTALNYLDNTSSYSLSKPHRNKIFHITNGKFYWILNPKELAAKGFAEDEHSYIEVTKYEEENFLEDIPDRRSVITDRLKSLEQTLGLELSPGGTPILDKKRFNVLYADKFDHVDTEYLTGKSYFLNPLVPVDIVLGDKLIHHAINANSLAYIVSSHVVEHIPDFIQFFKSCEKVLKKDGKILMYVPDKRYTFDVLRKLSTIEDIERAHAQKLTCPTMEMALEFFTNVDFNATTQDLWEPYYQPRPSLSQSEINERMISTNLSNLDMHCFTFTPDSFKALLLHIKENYLHGLEIVEVGQTKEMENEFLVELKFRTDREVN